ncbi:MAG: hypothetical protein ACE5ID_01275, partial [Acidobacteriota bacterium]
MRRGWKQSRTALAILSLLSGAWPAVAGGPTGGPRIQENRSFNRRMHLKAEALLPDGGLLAGEHGIPRPQRL